MHAQVVRQSRYGEPDCLAAIPPSSTQRPERSADWRDGGGINYTQRWAARGILSTNPAHQKPVNPFDFHVRRRPLPAF